MTAVSSHYLLGDGVVPDVVGPVTGYRNWLAEWYLHDVTRVRLHSTTRRATWEPGTWEVAVHEYSWLDQMEAEKAGKTLLVEHGAPHERCDCGIYASLTRLDFITYREKMVTPRERYIVGRVELAGKVITHERGYRGQLARPVAFLANSTSPLLELYSQIYDVPIEWGPFEPPDVYPHGKTRIIKHLRRSGRWKRSRSSTPSTGTT